jgi:Stage III sporulation protein AE (spore_III_AE).
MKKFIVLLTICLMLCLLEQETVYAAKEVDIDTSSLEDISFVEVEESLQGILNGESFRFKDSVLKLMTGEMPLSMENLGTLIWDSLFAGFREQKNTLIHILIIIIVAAIFNNFSNIFENGQVSEISFYVVYLLLFTILLRSFMGLTVVTTDTLTGIISFMQVLLPAYMLTVALAAGVTSALVFYEITLMIILVVQWVFVYLLIPAVNIYLVISLVNHLSKEALFSKIAKLIKSGVEWTLKVLFGAVVGVNIIQGLIAPMIDTVKINMINKTVSAIPGIGNTFNSITEIVLGSAVLIKNSVGVIAMIAILIVCSMPVIRLGITSVMYKLLGAVVQPIADKRIGSCIDDVGTGIWLLLRILTFGVALFIITIALIASGTNRGY